MDGGAQGDTPGAGQGTGHVVSGAGVSPCGAERGGGRHSRLTPHRGDGEGQWGDTPLGMGVDWGDTVG